MSTSKKVTNVALWILQTLVATMFIATGILKMSQPISSLSAMLPWTGQNSPIMVRGLGFLDVLGGVGILLPSLLRIKPQFTVITAFANIVLMICAIIFHVARGEASVIGFNFLLIAILTFIAWGRSSKVPIEAR